jgi:hypothetical protein
MIFDSYLGIRLIKSRYLKMTQAIQLIELYDCKKMILSIQITVHYKKKMFN